MGTASFSTSFGPCTLAWDDIRLTGFRLLDDAPGATGNAPAWVKALIERVRRHLDGDFQLFTDVPYDFSAVSTFQRAVYEAALSVPAGSTRTYGWLATTIGQSPSASRAVGTALGRNPWPLLVPCHRFVGAKGRLTGFSAPGGVATKLRLLALERVELFAT